MPWWIWGWIGILTLTMVFSAREDWAQGVARWKIAVDVFGHALTVMFVLVYFADSLRSPMGRACLPAAVLVGVWTLVRGVEELRIITDDPELSRRDVREYWILAAVVWWVLLFPAFVLGAVAGFRSW
ncbi:MAG: hypothetical protein AAGD06_25615 [Acidobacteriota bacterium]